MLDADDFGPLRPQPAIDATSQAIAGPLVAGDEDPTRPHWFWTGETDEQGRLVFFRPQALWRRRMVVGALSVGVAIIYVAALIALIVRPTGEPWLGAIVLAIGAMTHFGAVHYLKEPIKVPPERRPKFW